MSAKPTASTPIHAVWRHADLWYTGRQPLHSMVAQTVDQLDQLVNDLEAILPSNPGAIATGVLGYDTGPLRLGLPVESSSPALLHVHVFSADQVEKSGTLPRLSSPELTLKREFISDMSRDYYDHALKRIRDYLIAGDCYQINFARRFSSQFNGEPLAAWQRLATGHAAPHSSFFRCLNGDTVFGVSPERLLRVDDRHVLTEPIKGSRPRNADQETDTQLAADLLSSDKDRAENLMIVDLLRNDLGAICETGSVRSEALFELRKFSNVQHLVSSISGKLRADVSPLQALLSCFPGGSITGAPKKRAMEIIAELEPQPRGFYCGSQFSLTADGQLDSNILIRTFQTRGDEIFCHGGGGIVIDSDIEQEYLETGFKVSALMAAISN